VLKYTDEHHAGFRAGDVPGSIYSDEDRQFPWKIADFDAWASHLREGQQSCEYNLISLKKAVDVSSDLGELSPLDQIIRGKSIERRAPILTHVALGAQLASVRKI